MNLYRFSIRVFFHQFPILGLSLLIYLWWIDISRAQVSIDGRTPTQIINCGNNCASIEGGLQAGSNLFHSFKKFNVNHQQSLQFISPDDIDRIFSRVTGAHLSHINGALGVPGNADLFLLNPNGIIFGPNAQLNMGEGTDGGSFMATTANAIEFGEGSFFRAVDNKINPAILDISPSAFLFHNSDPQPINYQGGGNRTKKWNVLPDEVIRFLGGPITFQGATTISATQAQIELIAVSDVGKISFFEENGELNSSMLEDFTLADITLSHGVHIQAESGKVHIVADNLNVLDGSRISVSALDAFPPGEVIVRATGIVRLQGVTANQRHNAGFFAQIAGGSDTLTELGKISITARSLFIEDGAQVTTSTFTEQENIRGQDINIDVNIEEKIQLRGTGTIVNFSGNEVLVPSGLFSQSEAPGTAGNIQVRGNRLILQDLAAISTGGGGFGGAGEIRLNVGQLILQNEARIFSNVVGIEDGGNISIAGNNNDRLTLVFLADNSQISTSVDDTRSLAGDAQGGNIFLNADFLVANQSGNNDITANAQKGAGGLIEFQLAGGLFGMTQPIREDPDSNLDPRALDTNDITAFSLQNPTLDGDVIINTPGIDPDRRLPELQGELEAPQLQQRCYGDANRSNSSFIDAGQGGVPPNPGQADTSLTVWEDLRPVALDASASWQNDTPESRVPQLRTSSSIVEAQAWVVDTNGDIVLIADASGGTAMAPAYAPGMSNSSPCDRS